MSTLQPADMSYQPGIMQSLMLYINMPAICCMQASLPCLSRCTNPHSDADLTFCPAARQVFYYEKMEVSDFNNDVILAAACRTDVDKFCKDVKPGTHVCWGHI